MIRPDIQNEIDRLGLTDQDEIDTKIQELEANWYAPHKLNRRDAYPSIAEQLDQIYHEGIDAWKTTIAAVKAEYPKP